MTKGMLVLMKIFQPKEETKIYDLIAKRSNKDLNEWRNKRKQIYNIKKQKPCLWSRVLKIMAEHSHSIHKIKLIKKIDRKHQQNWRDRIRPKPDKDIIKIQTNDENKWNQIYHIKKAALAI